MFCKPFFRGVVFGSVSDRGDAGRWDAVGFGVRFGRHGLVWSDLFCFEWRGLVRVRKEGFVE